MPRRLHHLLPFLIGAVLTLTGAIPAPFDFLGAAFAQGNGGGGGNGGGNDGGNGSGGGAGGGNGNNGNGGGGPSASAPGLSKASGASGLADTGSPKAVVRQYVVENGLKQGDVAKTLKSWNSLNRNMQAYVANINNPKSLPGLQLAYISANLTAQSDLSIFTDLGGDPNNPPTAADLLAAQAVLADSTSTAQEKLDAQAVIDQYNAWTAYQAAEAAAQDAFMAASVSYPGPYSDATYGELRSLVDAIVAKKGLDALVTP